MTFGIPEEKAVAPVSTNAECCSTAVAVPVTRNDVGESGSHEGSTTNESYTRHRMDVASRSVNAPYQSAPGQHDLGIAQAILSFVLIVVTVTVACILIVLATRRSKDNRDGVRIEAHRSPLGKTSRPRMRH
ncbi:uncharacterized protein LOC142563806 [Dermacentor variabilis]|uniref:uncharacterized protein LOC142563806 n=1 Tax=Dermacentor variabilis TaxID=34621 RepID=UPI003F5C64C0